MGTLRARFLTLLVWVVGQLISLLLLIIGLIVSLLLLAVELLFALWALHGVSRLSTRPRGGPRATAGRPRVARAKMATESTLQCPPSTTSNSRCWTSHDGGDGGGFSQ